jgi:hypothetical protein
MHFTCIGWSSKKQNCISLSTAEAEYIATASGCTQLLWMRQTLKEYGVNCDKVPLLCDNQSAIKIAYNPVQIQQPSILRSGIILLEIMLLMVILTCICLHQGSTCRYIHEVP